MKNRIFNCKFLEYEGELSEKGGFRTILIQEGIGNLRDAFFYSKESLQYAVDNKIFEGKKIFADHPSTEEEETRPERSVKDVLGHFENIKLEEINGRAMITGTVRVPQGPSFDWVRSTFAHAIEYSKRYPDKDFVGLSINASGDAEEISMHDLLKIAPIATHEKIMKAMEQGVEMARITRKITDAVSCDMVTQAGAGGKILNLIEKEKLMKNKRKESEGTKQADTAGPEGHADYAADVELIKQMIDKYMGDDKANVNEAEYKQTSEAYTEMGMEAEEAYQAAAKHMKAASILAKKKEADKKDELSPEERTKKEAEEKKEANKKETDDKEKCEKKESDDKDEDDKKDEDDTEKKESSVSLVSRIAFLESEIAKRDLNDHIESTLAKSGMSRSATKLFKESIGTVKNKKEFDRLYKTFSEGFKAGNVGEELSFRESEKIINEESNESFLDLSNCKE